MGCWWNLPDVIMVRVAAAAPAAQAEPSDASGAPAVASSSPAALDAPAGSRVLFPGWPDLSTGTGKKIQQAELAPGVVRYDIVIEKKHWIKVRFHNWVILKNWVSWR